MKRTRAEAADLMRAHGIPQGADFHALPSDTVERITAGADAWRYRQPRNANGSRARYFYAHLSRLTTTQTR